ncbi:hypothetical protein [Candidatus Protochlamydia amoebophila]|uniref:Uncharacterized protein n=1 Tax=Protochlamydia amoebophila (strain UWE25) TaxID=264201 RepID=Q6MAM0_PARUW|nr:hypothetical protein [Candidatus Protochlamydia amoebophila]CAF24379.1 unnamed protein product [Candidatus Protochlamydia amoebophila UWE25]
MVNPIANPAQVLPVLPTEPHQPLSIRRLSTTRIVKMLTTEENEHLHTLTPQKRLSHLCCKIMRLANARLQKKGITPKSIGDEIEHRGLFELVIEKQDVGEGFSLLYYTRQISTLSKLAQSLLKLGGEASKMQSSRVEMIGFLFRQHIYSTSNKKQKKEDIYALTTSDAWREISHLTEFEFPQAILMRLLENKVHHVVYQPLVGNALRNEKDFKEGEELHITRYFDKFITQLTSRVRPQASLYCLKSFCNKGEKIPKNATQVKIELGAVRFQKQFALADYPSLLDHLSKIHHGQKTYLVKVGEKQKILGKGEEEKDHIDLAFWKYLKPVDPSEKAALEQLMDQSIWKAFQEGISLPLFFAHRLVKDYATSSSFRLVSHLIPQRKRKDCKWDSAKSAQEILHLLREVVPSLEKCQNADDFAKILKEIKIEFKVREKIEKSSLRKMFGGEIRITESQKSYFLVGGLWLSLSPDYLRWVRTEFRGLLRDCLLKPGDRRNLTHPWPANEAIKEAKKNGEGLYAEDVYNRSYASLDNYLIGDRVLVEKIELFDLLYMLDFGTTQEVILYHVKKGFGQETRDAASQIRVSLALVHEFLSDSAAKKPTRLDQLCEALEKRYPNCLEKVGQRQGLIDAFKRNQLTYTYAVYDDSSSNRSLWDEVNRKEELTVEDFEAINDKKKNISSQTIVESLQAAGFLAADGLLTTKFHGTTKKEFKEIISKQLNWTKSKADVLHKRICDLAVSPYDSLIARLELLKLRKQVESKQIKFRICEISKAGNVKKEIENEESRGSDVLKIPSLPVVKEIPILTEGSIFTYKDDRFQIEKTLGDGTCALHAVFGEPNASGYFFYPGGSEVARKSFADDLTKCLNNPMHPRKSEVSSAYEKLILDLLIGRGAQGINGKVLTSKLRVSGKEYQRKSNTFEKKRQKAVQDLESAFFKTFNKMQNKNAVKFPNLMNILNPDLNPKEKNTWAQLYRDNPKQLSAAFDQKREAIRQFFCADGFTKAYNAPVKFFKAIEQAEDELEKIEEEICHQPEVFNAYLACIQDLDYWFETNEICLAGLLRGQAVRIFAQTGNGEITIADEELIEGGGDVRLIFHYGRHFMRCTPLK